jgi:hypothetical protein
MTADEAIAIARDPMAAIRHAVHAKPRLRCACPVNRDGLPPPEHAIGCPLGMLITCLALHAHRQIEVADNAEPYVKIAAAFWTGWTVRAQPKRLYPDAETRDGVTSVCISSLETLDRVCEMMVRSLAECSGWRLRQGFETYEADGVTCVTWRIRFEDPAR